MKIVGLLFCFVVLGLCAFVWTPDKSRADLEARYMSYDDAFVTVLGTRLRVRDTGPKDNQTMPVILLHGFGASLETWQDWASALDDDRRVIRFDLPGSGLSDSDAKADYSDARSMALLAALMQAKGIRQANIIGNSLGGRIAWQFAQAYPVSVHKLVLISPDGFASPGFEYGKAAKVPVIMAAMRWTLPKSMLKANLASSYAEKARLTDATVTRYHDLMLAPGSRAALVARMEQTVLVDPKTVLPKITASTLLLWGEKDAMIPISNAQDYVRLLANPKIEILQGLGHVPFEEDPARSLAPLRMFLDAS